MQAEGVAAKAVGHHKSIIKAAIDRLEDLMAIGESRREAKQARRASGERVWAFSTGKIHSFKTRSVYQEQVLRFINWCRDTHQMKRLEDLDVRANELACQYLTEQIQARKSPYTLQVERSALRLFFGDRSLAESVILPRRTRTRIMRSRGPVRHDRHFQPVHWEPLLNFLRATGLRRNELRLLRIRDIIERDTDPDYFGQTTVKVVNGKGGKSRTVPVLAGHEQDVLAMRTGHTEEEPVFPRIPRHLDVHSFRRAYAQALYLCPGGCCHHPENASSQVTITLRRCSRCQKPLATTAGMSSSGITFDSTERHCSHNRQPIPCEYDSDKESGGQSVLMYQRLVDKAL